MPYPKSDVAVRRNELSRCVQKRASTPHSIRESARAREMMSAKRAGVVPGGAKPKYLPWTRALTAHPIVTHIDRSQCLANMCCDLAPMREDNRLVGRPLPRRAIE